MFASLARHILQVVTLVNLLLPCRSELAYVSGMIRGDVVTLDSKSFPEAIKDPSNPLWLLKFYAPWCGHCKKLAPVLDKAAVQLKGQMAIGKIDCTVEKKLCNEFNIRGYPTMKYSVDGELDDYPMGRDLDSIAKFSKKMSAPALQTVASYEDAMEFAKTKTETGVIFLGYDPTNKPEEASGFYEVFSTVARRKRAAGHFLWLEPSDPDSIKTPAIVKRIEPDVKVSFLENVESLTAESLTEWFDEQNLPLVNMLGPDNFQKIGKKGRPLAIAIADTEDGEQVKALKEHLLNYITSSENEKYHYGIMDGKKFSRFLEQFNVEEKHLPQFLALDVPKKTFWQNETYSNLFEFMKAIENGEIQSATATRSSANGILGTFEHYFLSYFPYSLVVLLLAVFGFVWMMVPAFEDDPYSNDPSALEEMTEEMEGTEKPSAKDGDTPVESKKKK